jgi:hypothetical protein
MAKNQKAQAVKKVDSGKIARTQARKERNRKKNGNSGTIVPFAKAARAAQLAMEKIAAERLKVLIMSGLDKVLTPELEARVKVNLLGNQDNTTRSVISLPQGHYLTIRKFGVNRYQIHASNTILGLEIGDHGTKACYGRLCTGIAGTVGPEKARAMVEKALEFVS